MVDKLIKIRHFAIKSSKQENAEKKMDQRQKWPLVAFINQIS
jgi:hypothetical protein